MRKEFTAISAFSTIIAFTAGAVLCMQISQLHLEVGAAIAAPVLWGLEVVVFGTAIYVWRRRASFLGWLAGIVGLLGMRVAILSAAAVVLVATQGNGNMPLALEETSALVTRGCGILFALMVCYPLRWWLPQRSALRKKRAFGDSAAVRSAEAQSEGGLLIVTVNDRNAKDGAVARDRKDRKALPRPEAIPVGLHSLEGEVTFPVSAVLALLPQAMVTDKALALGDTERVSIPLDVIHPQLREAQIVFTVSELRNWFPSSVRKALVASEDAGAEQENSLVILPLEEIVLQLPPGALELPPPSPPAWAGTEVTEALVFAKT